MLTSTNQCQRPIECGVLYRLKEELKVHGSGDVGWGGGSIGMGHSTNCHVLRGREAETRRLKIVICFDLSLQSKSPSLTTFSLPISLQAICIHSLAICPVCKKTQKIHSHGRCLSHMRIPCIIHPVAKSFISY